MTDKNQTLDSLNLEEKKSTELPWMLNGLTILSYIGCVYGALSGIYNYFTICKSAEKLASQDLPEVGGMIGKMMDSAIELAMKQCENRLAILVITIVTSLLCFFGAFMMRSLKKQGFILYMVGELIAPAALMVILGSAGFTDLMLVGAIVPIVMVIVFATQRKYLVH